MAARGARVGIDLELVVTEPQLHAALQDDLARGLARAVGVERLSLDAGDHPPGILLVAFQQERYFFP